MAWRKVNLASSSLSANAASFVNQTARDLHLLLTDHNIGPSASASVLGDSVISSLDEQPVSQAQVNDSRAHISSVRSTVQGGTGSVTLFPKSKLMAWPRSALVMRSDDAIFLNNEDQTGTPDVDINCNIWYDD